MLICIDTYIQREVFQVCNETDGSYRDAVFLGATVRTVTSEILTDDVILEWLFAPDIKLSGFAHFQH